MGAEITMATKYLFGLLCWLLVCSNAARGNQPNFLVVLTDDQDQLLNSTHPAYMPALDRWFAQGGLQFRNFVVSTSVCCPSRVNLLTGCYAHNTNVTGNVGPAGGYPKFRNLNLDDNWLPGWLQDGGYNTYFVGKFLNGYDLDIISHCPKGFTKFDALIKPYVLNYFNSSFSLNCAPGQLYQDYSTDVMAQKGLNYIQEAHDAGKPFWMQINPLAPHQGCGPFDTQADGDMCTAPPSPAPRHADLYPGLEIPNSPNYGLATPTGTGIPFATRYFNRENMNKLYRARIQSMRAVDEMLDAFMLKLQALGQIGNTYVVFMSDNGFHIGNHGVQKGKMLAYEEDVRVPFYIRGPGIPGGLITDYQATVVDLPATVLALAGLLLPDVLDGTPLPLQQILPTFVPPVPPQHAIPPKLRENVPHEMWGWGSDPAINGRDYRSVRVCTPFLVFGDVGAYDAAVHYGATNFGFHYAGTVAYSATPWGTAAGTANPASGVMTCYKYTVWCTGTRELYDLLLDPYEVNNRYADAMGTSLGMRFVDRLDAMLSALAFCSGAPCTDPLSLLHPQLDAPDFVQAMSPQYDDLYRQLVKFHFKQCTLYYQGQANEVGWYMPVPPFPDLSGTTRAPPDPPRGNAGARRSPPMPPPPVVQNNESPPPPVVKVDKSPPPPHNKESPPPLAVKDEESPPPPQQRRSPPPRGRLPPVRVVPGGGGNSGSTSPPPKFVMLG